ncbi:MAG TPA: amino acid adenylation domain-containing protein [Thermoanaerobaculia bacterium]|nr:amino acid adenylation domain-containing protein [Thermoanaerobaculia bacterium]
MTSENLAWWIDRLTPHPAESGPPLLRPRSKVYSPKRATVRLPIPAELSAAVDGKEGRLAELALAGIAGVLHRYSGNERIAVGSAVPPTGNGGGAGAAVTVLVDVADETPFSTLVETAARSAREAYLRSWPIAEVVSALGLQEIQNRHPLFSVAVAAPALSPLPGDLRNDVTVEIADQGATLVLDYNARLLEPEIVDRFGRHVLHFLAAGLAAPASPVHALDYLDPAERRLLLDEWSGGQVHFDDPRPVQRLFEEQVERTPGAEALVFGGQSLTFDEVNRRANRIAHLLRSQGAGVGQAVGLCVAPSPDLLIGLLGILKSGAAAVPIVPTFPPVRNALTIEDAGLSLIVTETGLRERLPASGRSGISAITALCLDALAGELAAQPEENPPSEATATDLVYILFTSGSTGRPKGVQMEHRSLVNLILWQRQRGEDPAGRRTLQRTSIGFDVSFQEIFSTWCFGGSLVVAPDAVRDDVSLLPSFVDEHRIARLFIPPVALHQLAASAQTQKCSLASLKEILVAGEALQISMAVIRLFREIQCALDNQYGPTETHVVTAHALTGLSTRWPALPPIGRPIANARVYLLDRWQQPVPVGVPGEIAIGGVPVARGYLRPLQPLRPEPGRSTMEEAFLADPFSEDAPENIGRLYRTGDVGRFLADGTIEFLGRRDEQVKIRGYRIELGEIESLLLAVQGVRQAAVAVHEDEARGKQLAAYVVTETPGKPEAADLRTYLLERLPGHMVPAPSAFVYLDTLPLTPTGKVDRKALPVPEMRPRELDDLSGKSDTEQQIAAIWGKVLGMESVGVGEDFLDLGGHSLLGIQIVSQINEVYHVRLPLSMFLRGTTVTRVAETVEEMSGLRRARPEASAAGETGRRAEVQEVDLGGRKIFCLQKAEAAYLYVDVFVHKTYDRAGIRYPEQGVVFDVGANIGLFTLYAKDRAPGLTVYAFEPVPPLFDVLRRNTESLQNVHRFDFALSDREGTAALTYYPTLSGMSSFYPDPGEERALLSTILRNLADQGWEGMREVLPFSAELVDDRLAATTFETPLRPLSSVLAETGMAQIAQIDLLKIDVQKAELDVLHGIAAEDWPKIRQLAVEVHDLDHQVEKVSSLLAGHGYRVSVEQDPLHKGSVVHFVYAIA